MPSERIGAYRCGNGCRTSALASIPHGSHAPSTTPGSSRWRSACAVVSVRHPPGRSRRPAIEGRAASSALCVSWACPTRAGRPSWTPWVRGPPRCMVHGPPMKHYPIATHFAKTLDNATVRRWAPRGLGHRQRGRITHGAPLRMSDVASMHRHTDDDNVAFFWHALCCTACLSPHGSAMSDAEKAHDGGGASREVTPTLPPVQAAARATGAERR